MMTRSQLSRWATRLSAGLAIGLASDAIALAVRCEAPLFAATALLDDVGQVPEPEPEEEAEEIIDEFKDFIESVSPDDFAT